VSLGSFSVKNPVLLNIVMVLILIAGFFSVSRLPREQFSEIPFYFVNIVVPYPGASAEDIEQSVTVKIESEMTGIENLDEVQSVTSEGLSVVTLQFDQGITDDQFDNLFQEVQNRFTNIELPDGTLQGTVDDFSTNDFLPVLEVVLYGNVEYGLLNRTAADLSDRLRTIQDVSGINRIGARDRQITIELNRQYLDALGISLNEVLGAVRAQNTTIPGGTLETSSREFLLRTVGLLEDAQSFRDIVIRRGQGQVVTVGDVATVTDGYDLEGTAARYNGRQAISLQVTKVPGGSSIDINDDVRALVAEFPLPAGIEADFFNDSTIQIRDSINVLVSNALIGLALLVVILLIFVGLRNAIMTAVGIPLTFALTFIVLEAFGETLNSNTLFGLVLVLGLIVDHAIVIVENSFRLQQEQGMSRHDAAIKGVDQVVVPVIAATLTTVAAFLPLTFLPGLIGKFLRVVPLTVSIALVASTFEAAVFLPSHYADWPGGEKLPTPRRWITALQNGFRRVLHVLYRRRGWVGIAAFLMMILVFGRISSIQQDLFSAEDYTVFYIDIEMPPGTPIEKTDEFVARYEERIVPLVTETGIVAVNAFVGFAGGDTENVRRTNVAQIVVDLAEKNQGRERSITEIMAAVEDRTRDIPGAEAVQFRKQQSGPPTDPPVVYRLFGDNYDELGVVADAIKAQLLGYPELFNIDDNLDAGTPELQIRVQEGRAAEYGLSSQAVGLFIRGIFDGVTAGTIFTDNEETGVVLRYGGNERIGIDSLLQLKIPTPDGRLVSFSSIATIEEGSAISSVRRIDGKREVTITAEAYSEQNVPAINAAIAESFENTFQSRYPGMVLSVGGEFAEIADTLFAILRVFVIGIFLIYLVLATQFNSYSQPVLILLTVPFAFVGGHPLSSRLRNAPLDDRHLCDGCACRHCGERHDRTGDLRERAPGGRVECGGSDRRCGGNAVASDNSYVNNDDSGSRTNRDRPGRRIGGLGADGEHDHLRADFFHGNDPGNCTQHLRGFL